MAAADVTMPIIGRKKRDYLGGAFAWLAAFCVVYFLRPEEFIPMGTFPIAKVVGGAAILAFGLVVMAHPDLLKFSPEMKYLMFLAIWFFLGVPFSPVWKGGAWSHSVDFVKVVPIALLVGLVANNVKRLKRLIFIETASTVLCVIVTLYLSHFTASEEHRLTGALNGIYGNPNDLALCIVLVFPFCAMFMLMTKNLFKKTLWALSMAMLGFALLLTYSRAGVVALMASAVIMVWEFGVKGRRHGLIIMSAFVGLCILVIAGPKGYLTRVASVLDPSLDPGQAYGSWQARKALLILSLTTTLTHPIFGVGCGDFQIIADWHVTHNSYTQISAEGGIPAVVLFLLIIYRTFKNLQTTEETSRGHEDLILLHGTLKVSYVAFLVGSFFDSVSYNFFPYFLVAYTGALLLISQERRKSDPPAVAPEDGGKGKKKRFKNSYMGRTISNQGVAVYHPVSRR